MTGLRGWILRRPGTAGLFICTCVVWVVALQPVGAQSLSGDSAFVVENWQVDAGLPNNSITSIIQTKDGYLWLGTSNGLTRFDGIRFAIFRAVDTPSLKSNRIRCLHEDRQGTLWIGTDEGGLIAYAGGQFTPFGTRDGLSSDSVLCAEEDVAGKLWIGTASGLNRWEAGRFTTFFKVDGLPDDRINAIAQSRGGLLFFGTGKGLCALDGGRLSAYEAENGGQTRDAIHAVIEDRIGQLWVSGDAGLFRMRSAAGGLPPLKISPAKTQAMLERNDGEIWFATSDGDLCRVVPQGAQAGCMVAHRFRSPITALCEDREGNLWVGTGADGLFRLKPRQLQWFPLPKNLDSGPDPFFFKTPDDEIWMTAGGNGLYRLETGGFVVKELPQMPEGVVVRTACGTRGGVFWIGTHGDGVFRCDHGKVTHFGQEDGISDSAIESLYADPNEGVWIGTRNGGLNYLKGDQVTRFNTPWGFSGNFACVLAKDDQNNLWIGTTGDGLFRLSKGKFTAFDEASGLPSGQIHALHVDEAGVLWIGTARGLCRVEAGRLTAFSAKSGLVDDTISQMESDGEGNLWLGSNRGIFRVIKDQLNAYAKGQVHFVHAVPYGKPDGIPNFQYLPAPRSETWQSYKGKVWFSTAKGLVLRVPSEPRWNRLPPPITIEQAFVDNESVPLGPTVRVAPGRESLQFQYTALSFTAPEKVSFRYRLEDFDRDWIEAGANRTARYSKVPSGHYAFRVMACNNDGVWNETGASLAVSVLPFWWATLWFRGAALAMLAGVAFGLYHLQQARRRELERLRVRIASDLHDDVGSSLWSITLLSQMLEKHGALGPDERHDVGEINRIAVQTSNSIRDIVWLINPAFDTVQDLALRMRDFAGTALRGTEYQFHCQEAGLTKKLPLDFRKNLFLLFKETLTNVAKHAHATRVEVALEEHPGLWRLTIRDNGIGFDLEAPVSGNGLKNLRARARKMGAQLHIESWPGQGTTLVFTAGWRRSVPSYFGAECGKK